MFCKKCGSSLPNGAIFCKKCGNKVEIKSPVTEENKPAAAAEQHNADLVCKKCGNRLLNGAMFCKKCGNKIEGKTVTEESKPAAAAEQHNAALVCKKCGNRLPDGVMFCKKCGNKIEGKSVTEESKPAAAAEQHNAALVCKKCGNRLLNGAMFCVKCGNKAERRPVMNENKPVAPPPVAPYYNAPQYTAPQYGTPVRPAERRGNAFIHAPKKIPKANLIIGTIGMLAGVAMFIVTMTTVHKMSNSEPADPNYGQQGGVTVDNHGGDTSGNAGGNTGGGGTTQPTTSKEQYTSPKTGKVFTIQDKGYASVTYNGKESTVTAQHKTNFPSEDHPYDSEFYVRFDSSIRLVFLLTESSDWKAGKSIALSDMKSAGSKVQLHGVIKSAASFIQTYTSERNDFGSSYFKDAQFTIIERDASTGLMKWYFYLKASKDDSTTEIEGVAYTVCGEEAGSGGGGGETVTPSSAIGKTKCGVCNGGKVRCTNCTNGFLQCPGCHGAKTYYDYAEKRDKVCPRCNGGGEIACTRSGCGGTGYIDCGSCGGDGYY